jgi:hydroxypyruvate isomerase
MRTTAPLHFAANLSFLFGERPFLERFAAAAAAGFRGVEFLAPYEHPPETIAGELRDNGLENVLFNLPPGNWAAGERGFAALPGREAEFRDGVMQALAYARTLGTRRLHAMAGIPPRDADAAECRATYLANLRFAAEAFAPHGITLTIEAINGFDMPGYFMQRVDDALAMIAEVARPNLRLQFDCYHVCRMGDDVAALLARALPHIAHVQVAGCPGRHEPCTGTLDYAPIWTQLRRAGYDGWVGCEYLPESNTEAGLSWLAAVDRA